MVRRYVVLALLLSSVFLGGLSILDGYIHRESVAPGNSTVKNIVYVVKSNPIIREDVRVYIRDISGTVPPSSGDWVIADLTIVRDSSLIINGSIVIEPTGTLVLINSKVYMNLHVDGEYNISVYGNLTVVDSKITSLNSDYNYFLVAYPLSYVRIENSAISYAGYRYFPVEVGLFFNSSMVVIIKNSNISNCLYGAYLFYVDNAVLENNIFVGSSYGVYLVTTNNSQIINNQFVGDNTGLVLAGNSRGNNISYNTFDSIANTGIVVGEDTTYNYIEHNVFIGSPIFDSGKENYIQYNRFINVKFGVTFWYAQKTIFRHNVFENSAIDYTNSEDLTFENNTINGKPVLYIYNVSDVHISEGDYGEIILDYTLRAYIYNLTMTDTIVGILVEDSSHLTVKQCTFINVDEPVEVSYTSDAWIMRNTIINAKSGIELYQSQKGIVKYNIIKNIRFEGIHIMTNSDNTIVAFNKVYNASSGIRSFNTYNLTVANNTIVESTYGISIVDTSTVYVYLNNLVDNLIHLYVDNSEGIYLHSKGMFRYTYRGQTFENYLGNYWSGYESIDSDNNGIWDEPYVADNYYNITDDYPLVSAVTIRDNQIILTSRPSIRIISPTNRSYLNYTEITVIWNATDPDNDIDHFEIAVDGEEVANSIPADVDQYSLNVTKGSHEIIVTVYDSAGNSASQKIVVTVDVIPPKILILSPHVGEVINTSKVEVKWNASDNISGIDHFEILVDGDPIDTNIPANQTSYTLMLSSGSHKIVLKAYDKAGNVASALILVRVNAPSSGGLKGSTTGLIIIVAVVAIIMVAAILIKKK